MTTDTHARIDLRLETRGAGDTIAWVTIDNARKLNCLSSALMTAFVDTIEQLGRRDDLRAIVVTGAGDKAFVGGADILEMGALTDAGQARAFITRVHKCCHAVRTAPVPVIARIQGFTPGAGLELAASCDLRVAAAGAVLGMPEVRLGLPSVVEAAVLPTLVGWGRAREMLMVGDNFSAEDALQWGLVERMVPAAELDAAVERWIDGLLRNGPQSVRRQKALMRRWERLSLDEAVQAGIDAFAATWDTDEPVRLLGEYRAAREAHKRSK
ncbi:MAG: enoyl-CoA hydratase [Burkholderiaceae bacterium]|nr:MAG: enoyl-CoA hydratase [Burkholderiaceae bacterium]